MVKASEAVNTAKVTAEAERRKSVAIIAATQEAEAAAVRMRQSAETELTVAKKKSEATIIAAEAMAKESNL